MLLLVAEEKLPIFMFVGHFTVTYYLTLFNTGLLFREPSYIMYEQVQGRLSRRGNHPPKIV